MLPALVTSVHRRYVADRPTVIGWADCTIAAPEGLDGNVSLNFAAKGTQAVARMRCIHTENPRPRDQLPYSESHAITLNRNSHNSSSPGPSRIETSGGTTDSELPRKLPTCFPLPTLCATRVHRTR